MRATMMRGAGDVRTENVPDATLIDPTDAILRVTHACICGSDLWRRPRQERGTGGRRSGRAIGRVGVPQDATIPASQTAFYKNITIGGGPVPVRAYIDELLPDILHGRIQPGKVFDRTVGLDGLPDGYRAMADRESIKVMVRP